MAKISVNCGEFLACPAAEPVRFRSPRYVFGQIESALQRLGHVEKLVEVITASPYEEGAGLPRREEDHAYGKIVLRPPSIFHKGRRREEPKIEIWYDSLLTGDSLQDAIIAHVSKELTWYRECLELSLSVLDSHLR